MTLVDRSVRRQLTAAMALALALALVLPSVAFAQARDAVSTDSACEGTPEDIDFPDIDGNTFEEEIKCLAWYEVTKGTNDGTYEPGRKVSRWQMALFIYRVAQYMDPFVDPNLPEPSDYGFQDIDDVDAEAQDAINVLAEVDVVRGKNATTYAPGETVRRDQMASFINRLQEWATGSTHEGPGEADAQAYGYPDVPVDNVHGTNIEDLTAAGIVQGKTNGKYAPAEGVNRGQMAAFITRDLAVNVNEGVIEPKMDDNVPVDGPTGVVTAVDTGANTYSFVDNSTDEEIDVDYEPGDVFYVDGETASNAAFEADIEVGDVIEYEDRGDDPSAHSLTNTVTESGFIGDYNTVATTIDVINTVSGDVVETFDYSGDLYTVDGEAATQAEFEEQLNAGDNIAVDNIDEDDDGDPVETYHLTNATLSGTVDDFTLGTSLDVELASGAVVTGIDYTTGDSFTVDGQAAALGSFEEDLSVGDSVTYSRVDDVVAFTLVNGAPTTVSGLATEDLAPADGFVIVNEDGQITIDYSGDPPEGTENRFYVDGELVTQAEFEAEYTAGDSVSFTEGDEDTDQDRVIALTNQVLRGEPDNVAIGVAGGGMFDVVGPDGTTVLDQGAYLATDLHVNGAEVDEATFEAYLVALEDGVIDGYVEVDLDETPEEFNIVVED